MYDTDKFTWLQARQVWTFSMLYRQVEQNEQWLQIAQNGIRFLTSHGRDKNGDFYFSLDRSGMPLTFPFNIYSECFAALAFGEYAKISEEQAHIEIALEAYRKFMQRRNDPKGSFEKTTGNRPMQSLGLPMMTANLTYHLEDVLNLTDSHEIYEQCIRQILDRQFNPETGFIHEYVGLDGRNTDSFEGRLINPGHGLESMWFLMDVAERLNKPSMIEKLVEMSLKTLERSWDKEHGGIFYFMDSKNYPLQQLEWDQKLWWVHQEALIALLKGFFHTRQESVWQWYEKVHQYTWQHFPDKKYGEWYGYLSRQGDPHTTMKGGKWKGCFHTIRFMYECWRIFKKMAQH